MLGLVGFRWKPSKNCTLPRYLEYGGPASSSCTSGELTNLRRLQREATRMVFGLCGCSYKRCIHVTVLFPMTYRRTRGDLIYTRRIICGDLDPDLQTKVPLRVYSRRQGHSFTLMKQQSAALPLVCRLSRRVTKI